MSDEVQLSMSLPLDGDGFLRRECPTCVREFKWLPSPDQLEEGNGESRAAAPDVQPPETYYCPYCAVTAPPDAWFTKAQTTRSAASAAPATSSGTPTSPSTRTPAGAASLAPPSRAAATSSTTPADSSSTSSRS